jgi:hypothetical protein
MKIPILAVYIYSQRLMLPMDKVVSNNCESGYISRLELYAPFHTCFKKRRQRYSVIVFESQFSGFFLAKKLWKNYAAFAAIFCFFSFQMSACKDKKVSSTSQTIAIFLFLKFCKWTYIWKFRKGGGCTENHYRSWAPVWGWNPLGQIGTEIAKIVTSNGSTWKTFLLPSLNFNENIDCVVWPPFKELIDIRCSL